MEAADLVESPGHHYTAGQGEGGWVGPDYYTLIYHTYILNTTMVGEG